MNNSASTDEDFEIIDPEKQGLFVKYTGFENIPFDPQGRLTDVRIEFLESSKGIIKNLEQTLTDGYARVVLVVGAAGIGKSTTIEELNQRINRNKGEFKSVKGISFGEKLRHVEEIREYRQFILKTINSNLKHVLKEKGDWEDFQPRYNKTKKEHEQEYVPEIYAGLKTLKKMGYKLIHFYIDELDLLEGVEPATQTNFIHFIRDLGEEMINQSIPVAISLYAVKEATAIIEKIFSTAHLPANMSIDRVYLFATKEEIKKIYKQRILLKEREVKGGGTVHFRANARHKIESRYSTYHPLTEDSIDSLYDFVVRDLQEPPNELSTLRPLFRMFHAAFWHVVNNNTREPLNKQLVKKIYNDSWFKKFVYDPLIRKRLGPIQRLTPQEKEELRSKLGNLNRPAEWSLPDTFSLFVEGLRKCIGIMDEKRHLAKLEMSRKQDEIHEKKVIYGSTYSDFSDARVHFNVRTNVALFPTRFDKETFMKCRKEALSKLPYGQINCWIIGVFEPNIQYVKTLGLPNLEGETHFFFDKEQITRILCQSVVDPTSKTRISDESKLARVNELVSELVNKIAFQGEIFEDLGKPTSTLSRLLMSILLEVGERENNEFLKDFVDVKQKNTVGKYDRYHDLTRNGFITEVSPAEGRYRFHFPRSLVQACQHIMEGEIQGDVDGERFFGQVWSFIRRYLESFCILEQNEFRIKGIKEIDKEISKLHERVKRLHDDISSGTVPSDVEDVYEKAKNCISFYEKTSALAFQKQLSISKEIENYVIRSLKKYYLNYALDYLREVKRTVEENVPRIEITPETIRESRPKGTIIEKSIKVKNTGRKDLIIRKIQMSNENIEVLTETPIVIAPKKDANIGFSINLIEDSQNLLLLETNDPKSPNPSINIVTKTIPKIEEKPKEIKRETEEMPLPLDVVLEILSRFPSGEIIPQAKNKGITDEDVAMSLFKLLKKKKIEVRLK